MTLASGARQLVVHDALLLGDNITHNCFNKNNNTRLTKIDKPQLNTEMLKVKVIHT